MIFSKTNKERNCIRVYADEAQLQSCMDQLHERQKHIQSLSHSLGLGGNEVRLSILYLLQTQQKLCVCDLSDVLRMSVPAVSQHLRKLKDGGILNNEKVGKTIFYSLSELGDSVFGSMIQGIRNSAETKESTSLNIDS